VLFKIITHRFRQHGSVKQNTGHTLRQAQGERKGKINHIDKLRANGKGKLIISADSGRTDGKNQSFDKLRVNGWGEINHIRKKIRSS